MKAVKYYIKIQSGHIHANYDESIIYIPEQKASIFRSGGSTFGRFEYGISTKEHSIKEGEIIFGGGNPGETDEQYSKKIETEKARHEETVKRIEIENRSGASTTLIGNFQPFSVRRGPQFLNIEFIDIEIADFDKLLEIYNSQEYMNERIKEILGEKK